MTSTLPTAAIAGFRPVQKHSAAPGSSRVTREIETSFVAALLDAALPKGKSIFGKGLSGSIARESLVHQIALAVSERSLLGLGKAPEEAADLVSRPSAARPVGEQPQKRSMA